MFSNGVQRFQVSINLTLVLSSHKLNRRLFYVENFIRADWQIHISNVQKNIIYAHFHALFYYLSGVCFFPWPVQKIVALGLPQGVITKCVLLMFQKF